MGKSVLKEIIIILLLSLAILLVLGILFYDHIPILKTLPQEVEYTTSEEVKSLTSNSNIDEQTVVMTYSVDSTDLNNYQRSQDYVPGKPDPFSSSSTSSESDNTGATNSATGEPTTNNSSSSSAENNSTNTNNSDSTNSGTNQNTTDSSNGILFKDDGSK